jgi:hypothetical protein
MKRTLSIAAAVIGMGLATSAFAGPGPGHPHFIGGTFVARHTPGGEKAPYALTGAKAADTTRYRWETKQVETNHGRRVIYVRTAIQEGMQ